ncbi:hypothetical protein GGI05_000395, partial [Coemansia sp. RSA 2603]
CAVLVLIGGLLAGLTLGLMSLDEMNLQILATSGTPLQQHYAQCIQPLRKNGHWLLVTLLLGNTVVNETLPIIMDSVFGGGGVTAIVVSTVSIVLFGEIIPQSLCARYGLAIGAFFAYPVRILQYILSPLGYPIALLLDYILGPDHGATYKKAQLKELVSLSDAAHGGNLSADEVTIIRGALDLSEKLVVDVMTDLCNVFMVALDARLDRRLLTEMLRRGHSRVPVYNSRREDIVGVLLIKSLILLDPDDAVPVRDVCIAPIPLVTTTTSLYEILNAFQEGGSHMAVVMGPPLVVEASMADPSISAGPLRPKPHLGLDESSSSSSSEDTLAESTPLLPSDGQKTPPIPNYIVSVAAPDNVALASYVPIGIITLEDVIEELIQEEIIDETDEFVDIRRKIKVHLTAHTQKYISFCMASYFTELGVKEREDNQDDLPRRLRAPWANNVVNDFMFIDSSNRQTPVGAQASPESYLNVARLFGEFMDNDQESEHQRFLENLIMQLHEEANASITGPPPASREFIQSLPRATKEECKDVDCIVCNERVDIPVENGSTEPATRLPCKHYFHVTCIKPWLELHNTCPMCRYEVPSDDPKWLEKKREANRESVEELKEMMMYG